MRQITAAHVLPPASRSNTPGRPRQTPNSDPILPATHIETRILQLVENTGQSKTLIETKRQVNFSDFHSKYAPRAAQNPRRKASSILRGGTKSGERKRCPGEMHNGAQAARNLDDAASLNGNGIRPSLNEIFLNWVAELGMNQRREANKKKQRADHNPNFRAHRRAPDRLSRRFHFLRCSQASKSSAPAAPEVARVGREISMNPLLNETNSWSGNGRLARRIEKGKRHGARPHGVAHGFNGELHGE